MLDTKTKVRKEASMRMSDIRDKLKAINKELNKPRFYSTAYVAEKADKISHQAKQLIRMSRIMDELDRR